MGKILFGKSSRKFNIIILSLCFVLISNSKSYAVMDLFDLVQGINWSSCIAYQIDGPCWLKDKFGVKIPGIKIKHWTPAAVIETPRAPLTTNLPFLGSILGMISIPGGYGGGGGSANSNQSNMQFFESHIMSIPDIYMSLPNFTAPLGTCGDYSYDTVEPVYLSELDAVSWRTGYSDYMSFDTFFSAIGSSALGLSQICSMSSIPIIGGWIPLGDMCMGTWGPTYPRSGFTSANSEAVRSAAAAFKAASVVSNPGVGRIVIKPGAWKSSSNDRLQGVYPYPTGCFKVGTPPYPTSGVDMSAPPGTGFIWIYWKKVSCCKNPALSF